MNIIISPAKKININNDDIVNISMPSLLSKTYILYEKLKSLQYEDLKKILNCSDNIAKLNFERYKYMNLERNLSPAIISYEGIQYKYMSPNSFTYDEFEFANNHLKILSGFYGILKPLDGITPYRLEMQSKFNVDKYENLYDFWDDSIYKELTKDSNIILNLASKEYSKCIEKYVTDNDTFISCTFGSLKDNKIKVKATEAKMARGLMVRYICSNSIEDIDDIKGFSDMNFTYSSDLSTNNNFVFLR